MPIFPEPSTGDVTGALAESHPTGPTGPGWTAHVRVVHTVDPALVGQTFELQDSLRIGRRVDGARLSDPALSRTHAEIHRSPGGATLALSTPRARRSWHDGAPLAPGARRPLADGDVIRLADTVLVFRFGPPADDPDHRFMPGRAPAVRRICREADARLDGAEPVVIVGETGTGKEFAARALAAGRPGPFVAINCAELRGGAAAQKLFGTAPGAFTGVQGRPGLFEQAADGTLFLDELGEMPPEAQAILLRVLETGVYRREGGERAQRSTARIVAATHVDLDVAVGVGRFRRDLRARLYRDGLPIELPPLRARIEDLGRWIGELAGLEPAAFTAGAFEALALYPWPENLRELQSVARTAHRRAGDRPIGSRHLPDAVAVVRARARVVDPTPVHSKPCPAPVLDRETVEAALKACGGSIRASAARLGTSRRTLRRVCERLGIDVEAARGQD